MTSPNKKVVIIQYRLLHYRVQLFQLMRTLCREHGIDLHIVHGQPTEQELKKKDTGHINWADSVSNKYITVGNRDIIWQPYPDHHKDADLVIMMQENRLLSNYPWLFGLHKSHAKIAYWGHGKNFQSIKPDGLREAWKTRLINKVDWWFAYTSMTVDILRSCGYPADQITCLNNAIDDSSFRRDLAAVTEEEVAEARARLEIDPDARIALFCGSLYPDKRLDLLITAGDWIRERYPKFTLVVLGDGPSMPVLQHAALSRPWLKLLGVTKGHAKAVHFRMAHVMMNPGLVGLHVVDAFCGGLVMVTTSNAMHSPEVAYLKDQVNGRMCGDRVEEYGGAVLELLLNDDKFISLQAAALRAAQDYTLTAMAGNFCSGIVRALAA